MLDASSVIVAASRRSRHYGVIYSPPHPPLFQLKEGSLMAEGHYDAGLKM